MAAVWAGTRPANSASTCAGAGFKQHAGAVIKAMLEGRPMPVDDQAAWNEQVLEAAVYRSAKTGKRVVLDEIDKELRS
jgi:gluconate kinase